MPRVQLPAVTPKRKAWNKGRIVGQKRPLLPKQVWAIRARLELANNLAKRALIHYRSQAAGYPGSQKRKARMSFNDLAKKEAADKKASQEKDTKPQTATKRPPEA
jgi:hypothetical protein